MTWPSWAVWLAALLAAASLALLLVELRRRERGGGLIVVTGVLAVLGLLAAVLRPARVTARESLVGARVVVLADASRSMALPQAGGPRAAARDEALAGLARSASAARLAVLAFGDGPPTPMPDGKRSTTEAHSDLGAALRALATSAEERPSAIVVVSDGRLDDPPEDASYENLKALGDTLHVPIDAVATTTDAPADASVRHVSAAGAAVAHVPLPLRVEVGCAGGLACDDVTVTAKELRDDGPPSLLASGVAHVKGGKAAIDLPVTLERAGARIVEVAIVAPPGDTLPENDRRLVTFHVARERVRVLHVAGRPTDDVRALRLWLKGDASVDVVAFFILRTPTDDVHATSNELALIPFPVDELFTEHLPSFDAIVLQDFDAQPYGLEKYLPNIARYVRAGGGLVMVGGQNSFVAGGYAGTPLADVLPVSLDGSSGATAADTSALVPTWTAEGRAAPLLQPLRDVVGDELPEMAGANVLGDVRPGAVALWAHPSRSTKSGAPMPVLAVGEQGDGRSVALGVDGAWRLAFSGLGSRTGGRGHGALVGRLARLAHAGSPLRERPDRGRRKLHGRPAGDVARPAAPVPREQPRAEGLARDRSHRPAPGADPPRAVPARRRQHGRRLDPPLDPGGYGRAAAGRSGRGDAVRLRVRGRRRRVGRLAAGPRPPEATGGGHGRHLPQPERRGADAPPEADRRERRAPREPGRAAVGVDARRDGAARGALDRPEAERADVRRGLGPLCSGPCSAPPPPRSP